MTKPNFTPDAHSMKMEISKLKKQLAKADEYAAELEVKKDALQKSLDECASKLAVKNTSSKESLENCTEKLLKLSENLAKANQTITALESETDKREKVLKRKIEAERFKKEEFVRWVDTLIEEQKELREQRFRAFGNEEYLIFFDNGEDYPDSMVAPVVMSADKFRELHYARAQLAETNEKLAVLEKTDSIFSSGANFDFDDLTSYFPEELDKFAKDQQIKALEFILGRVESVTVSHAVKDHIVHRIKQLRKGNSDA
ncbi:hypothetical protein AD45P2_00395 [Alteromonas phage vB_AmaP_AD45-P2]|uniref:Uncharacterized protein n=1 Tax=Pseudorhizobium pelagicum TaxID=1509405 RepID=A0A922TAF4_9HYPH|nr:hypothetical protein [Pseudorhizobium pelagicum]YP_008126049.1 hypothetical protein M610_gp103 [Alteromonas phage vB_AmaP_AD45-P1]AGM46896.1 hypothetical protein AD45P1_00390 [Alteromonas phage vB_AmaP_AD45-P1]AGM47250.1 hypothetical protein AD45P2_00395 [Alteromonas phage vB_AmaP_AD45-P2]KEQ05630.1 hypothetical protein GV68_08865 [Pseudorhizobium pelagicum]